MSDQLTPRQREIVENMRETGKRIVEYAEGWFLHVTDGDRALIEVSQDDLGKLLRVGAIVPIHAEHDPMPDHVLSPEYQHGESDE